MSKNCCRTENVQKKIDKGCCRNVNPYACHPCNFGIPYTFIFPPQPTPPPVTGQAHLLLNASYNIAATQVIFNVTNSSAAGATVPAENTVVVITPDPGATFTLADIAVTTGTFIINGSGDIEWTVGTLAVDGTAQITIIQPEPTAGTQTWTGIATTTTPNTPVGNDNETSVTFGLIGGGHLTLVAAWDPDGGVEGEGVFTVTNNGAIVATLVDVVITPNPVNGVTAGDVIVPPGTTVAVDGSGVITWSIPSMAVSDVLELRFPQRPVIEPDTQVWEGTATADNFTQVDGQNEAGFTLSLVDDGHLTLAAAYDAVTNVVSFTATNDGGSDATDATLTITPNPLGAPIFDVGDITGAPPGSTVAVDSVTGVITITVPSFVVGDSFTIEFVQPPNVPSMEWDGSIVATNFVQSDGANEANIAVPIINAVHFLLTAEANVNDVTYTLDNIGTLDAADGVVTITSAPPVLGFAPGDFGFTPSVGTAVYDPVTGIITWTTGPVLVSDTPFTLEFTQPNGLPSTTWSGVATTSTTPVVLGDNTADVTIGPTLAVRLELTNVVSADKVTFSLANIGSLVAADSDVELISSVDLSSFGLGSGDFGFTVSAGTVSYADPGTISWIPGPLAVGATVTLDFTQPPGLGALDWVGTATTTTTPVIEDVNTSTANVADIQAIINFTGVDNGGGVGVFTIENTSSIDANIAISGLTITNPDSILLAAGDVVLNPPGFAAPPTITPGSGDIIFDAFTVPAGATFTVELNNAAAGAGTAWTAVLAAPSPFTIVTSPVVITITP